MQIQTYGSKALPVCQINRHGVSTKEDNYIIYYCSFTIFLIKGCSTYHYKGTVGNTKCLKCRNGKTANTIHTKCECKDDHYIGNDKDGPCYGMYPNH